MIYTSFMDQIYWNNYFVFFFLHIYGDIKVSCLNFNFLIVNLFGKHKIFIEYFNIFTLKH